MRTTLDVADDVLLSARELASRQKRSTGEVLSELARLGLKVAQQGRPRGGKSVLGFRSVPRRGGVVTNEVIDRLRDQDAY